MARIAGITAILWASVSAAPALADPPAPEAVTAVFACKQIAEPGARLACYDAAAARLADAQTAGEVVMIDRGGADSLRREAFGFALPSLPRLFSAGRADAPDLREVRLEIERVSRGGDGRAIVTMRDGEVWTQIDDASSARLRPGGAVSVRRAALGSYLMDVEAGGPALRVRRTQ